jgi:hypothetical protein
MVQKEAAFERFSSVPSLRSGQALRDASPPAALLKDEGDRG